jgi:hypothetical protein
MSATMGWSGNTGPAGSEMLGVIAVYHLPQWRASDQHTVLGYFGRMANCVEGDWPFSRHNGLNWFLWDVVEYRSRSSYRLMWNRCGWCLRILQGRLTAVLRINLGRPAVHNPLRPVNIVDRGTRGSRQPGADRNQR